MIRDTFKKYTEHYVLHFERNSYILVISVEVVERRFEQSRGVGHGGHTAFHSFIEHGVERPGA